MKGKFRFQRPASIKVVGSYLLGTVTKPDLNVDIAVQMPKVITRKSIPILFTRSFVFGLCVSSLLTRKGPVGCSNFAVQGCS